MLFQFIDIGYAFSILFLIVFALISKKQISIYLKNCIVVSNHLLILFSWYLLYQFYQIIQFILSLNLKMDKVPKQPIEISWFQIKFLLIVTLPYLFLFKKLSKNYVLSVAMLILLQWDFFAMLYNSFIKGEENSGILFYIPYLADLKILNYICLFIAVYALLWLLKRLPSQQVK